MPFEDLTGKSRSFWRIFIVFLSIMMLIGLWQDHSSRVDRAQLHSMQSQLQQQQLVLEATVKAQNDFGVHNREMLDARAKCQIMLFNAVASGRRFTPAELQTIRDLWQKAEYHLIQEKFVK